MWGVFHAHGWRAGIVLSQLPYVYNGVMTALQSVEHSRALWPEPLIERWEERAAIMEYEGRLSREDAAWQPSCACKGKPSYNEPW
jgi:hypothetical protein